MTDDDSPRIRLRVLGVVSFSLLVALVARLWFLQVLNADAYEQQAVANTERVVKVDAPRGRIFDADGRAARRQPRRHDGEHRQGGVRARARRQAQGGRAQRGARRGSRSRSRRAGQLTKVDDIERKLRNSQYSRIGEVPDRARRRRRAHGAHRRAPRGRTPASSSARRRCATTRTATSPRTCSVTSARSTTSSTSRRRTRRRATTSTTRSARPASSSSSRTCCAARRARRCTRSTGRSA